MTVLDNRARTLEGLKSQAFDLLVIGGGITGAGVARDAALRGMRVVVVEQNDFGSGTSSRSSRLVHGGVRYLEHGALRLVFESSRERRTLMRIAPHLVRPLPFTWPVYHGARIPRWKLGAGLALYDALALFRNVGRHRSLSTGEVLRREPALRGEQLEGGASYWDAATDDSRLTLANVLDAQSAGAVVLNHVRVVSIRSTRGRISGAQVEDHVLGGTYDISARAVVNAGGPWSDRVQSLAGVDASAVRGSKGVHVAVPRSRIGNAAAVTLTAPQDGRVMFVLPAGAFAIIGTTDTFEESSPDDVRATERDVEYLLSAANHYFPEAQLIRGDVVSAWAGIRPLAAQRARGVDPGAASREHTIEESAPGLVRVTGGKLTTYRAMAAEVVDAVERAIGRLHAPTVTARRALPGGVIADTAAMIHAAADAMGDEVIAERFVHSYGSAWRDVWRYVEADGVLGARVVPERPYLLAELRHAVEHESAVTLGDLLIRRTAIAFETMDHGHAAARGIVAQVRGWIGAPPGWEDRALLDFSRETQAMFAVNSGR